MRANAYSYFPASDGRSSRSTRMRGAFGRLRVSSLEGCMPTATLLLADDDRLVLTTLAEGFRQAGYNVLEASDGDAAIRIAEEHAPDLAILDMRMLGRDGHDVAVWLRRHTDIPFLFLSAYSDELTVTKAIAAGALGYLIKPLNVTQILPSIEAALTRGRELIALLEEESHLSAALRIGRQTSVAVGILMARHHLTEQAAFDRLRSQARAERRKVSDLAAELISTAGLNSGGV